MPRVLYVVLRVDHEYGNQFEAVSTTRAAAQAYIDERRSVFNSREYIVREEWDLAAPSD